LDELFATARKEVNEAKNGTSKSLKNQTVAMLFSTVNPSQKKPPHASARPLVTQHSPHMPLIIRRICRIINGDRR